jgi:hypothetical protein
MPEQPERYQPLPSLLQVPGFLLRKLPPRRRRMVVIAGSAFLAALAIAAAVGLPAIHARQRADARAQAHRNALARQRLLAGYARQALPRRGTGPAARGLHGAPAIAARRQLVTILQADIVADARARAVRTLDYRSAECSAYPKEVAQRPPQDDVARPTAVFECIAATADVGAGATTTGSIIGQPFRALVDFERGAFAWCMIVQRPGELSIGTGPVLAVPRACGGRG